MKKILSLILCVCMVVPMLAVIASAVPYAPSGVGWKDFGQQHIYFHEVNPGAAPPVMDGYVKESDGYGEPVAIYGYRYIATVDKVVTDSMSNPLPEYKLREDGNYFVYPDNDTPDEVWNSISKIESVSFYNYIHTNYREQGSWTTVAIYFYVPETDSIVRAYNITADNLAAKTAENYVPYVAQDSAGNVYLNEVIMLEGETVDWETNYTDYYTLAATDSSGNRFFKPVTGKTAPEWKPNTYYYGEPYKPSKVYIQRSSNNLAIAQANNDLRGHHTILPEQVNVYARYDDEFYYQAIEVKELAHVKNNYFLTIGWSTVMSNSLAAQQGSQSIYYYIRRDADFGDVARTNAYAGSNMRTYANLYQNFDVNYIGLVLAKYGKEGVTNPKQIGYVQSEAEGDFAINYTPYVAPTAPADDPDWEDPADDPYQSCKYGSTVYEFRQKWTIINGQYDGNPDVSPIPEAFVEYKSISLESTLPYTCNVFRFEVPRETNYLPGGLNRSSYGNYPIEMYTMRYPSVKGMKAGTYRFFWTSISPSYSTYTDKMTSDYFGVNDGGKEYGATEIRPVWFPAGPELGEEYVEPTLYGAQLRADSSEVQKMRLLLSVEEREDSTKTIAEVGAIVAPTEVVRRQQLRLGQSSVDYIAEEYPTLYGIVDGKWVNLCTADNAKYFGASPTPNGDGSYLTSDTVGGKPSGIYTIYTLKADLENPYDTTVKDGVSYNIYDVVFGGRNGEGLYHDFDDWFTFYTIRPYVKYTDGTVSYGEHEYKSLYYLACWTIQEIITSYNSTNGYTAVDKKYNMDQMQLSTWKDADGKDIVDANGNPIYIPLAAETTTQSVYAGGGEYSIYIPYRRAEVFRWYAVRLVSQNNGNTPLRNDEYETFSPETKQLVQNYMEMLENIWDIIETAEQTVYFQVTSTRD